MGWSAESSVTVCVCVCVSVCVCVLVSHHKTVTHSYYHTHVHYTQLTKRPPPLDERKPIYLFPHGSGEALFSSVESVSSRSGSISSVVVKHSELFASGYTNDDVCAIHGVHGGCCVCVCVCVCACECVWFMYTCECVYCY